MAKITFYYTDNTNTQLTGCSKTDIKNLRKFIDGIESVNDARYLLANNDSLNQVIFLKHVKYISVEEDK